MPDQPPYPPSILHAFIESARRTPEKACLLFEGQRYTYTAFLGEVRRWATALRAWGLQPGDRVALFLENSPTFLAAYLGTQLAGGIVVLVNTQYRQVELRHILSDSGARLCITDTAGERELDRVRAELPALERTILAEDAEAFLAGGGGQVTGGAQEAAGVKAAGGGAQMNADALAGLPALPEPSATALIAYTSGTTGRSKGAMLSHSNLAANSWAVTTAWHWTGADHLLVMLPLFHVHGLCVGIHGSWLVGGTAELHRRFDAAIAYDRLRCGDVTMFFGVPTMYTRLIAEGERRIAAGEATPPPIRLYVSGSAPLSVQTFEQFERLFHQVILERYGMSETIMNLTNPYDGERRPGTVGGPFPGQEARIVDVRSRQPILDETPGEIQVRGPHVFKGYWERPDATAEAFDSEGWFNTGDLGWRSADGYYTISGRARELIITGGYNVYPREVEEVLETHSAVAEAAVLGLPDPEFGEQIVAAIVCEPTARPTPEALIDHCRDQLASYKKPKRIVFVDSLPRNALGKIQKHILREQIEALPANAK